MFRVLAGKCPDPGSVCPAEMLQRGSHLNRGPKPPQHLRPQQARREEGALS